MDVLHDETNHRFYIPLEGGQEVDLFYRRVGNALDFYHTSVPPTVRKRGLAEQVVEAGFRYAEANHFKVIPSCSYVSDRFLKKRAEFLPLVSFSPAD